MNHDVTPGLQTDMRLPEGTLLLLMQDAFHIPHDLIVIRRNDSKQKFLDGSLAHWERHGTLLGQNSAQYLFVRKARHITVKESLSKGLPSANEGSVF